MGFTFKDFKQVINYKIAEWWGTEFQVYITPETLFAESNFTKYHEQSQLKFNKSDKAAQESATLVGSIKAMDDE